MKKTLLFLPLYAGLLAFTPIMESPDVPADIQALFDKNGCAACHNVSKKMVGPSWTDIAAKGYSKKKIGQLVAKPVPANWPGFVPMAAQKVPKAEMDKIAGWLVSIIN